MIKGFRFTNQLANAEVDARIHQEFLNKNDGIFYGMELSYTNNSVTIAEGLCEIAGRPIAVIDTETVAVGTESLYCLLVLEIDLSKDSTKDTFNQASFKLLTSSTSYPTVTQQDINKYSGTDTIYQLEFARFKSGSTGISDFKDTRQFLNFDGIYTQIKANCENIIEQIKQELASVEDGSAYILRNNIVVLNGITNIHVDADSSLSHQFNLNYPSGFNKNNTIILAFGSRRADNEALGFSFGTLSVSAASALISTSMGKKVTLKEDNMLCNIYFNYNGASHNAYDYEFEYKIVLMKLPELTEGVDYTLGDVNGDGQINSDDFDLVNSYMEGSSSLTRQQFEAADINGDGKIDAMDTYKLQQYIANGTPLD